MSIRDQNLNQMTDEEIDKDLNGLTYTGSPLYMGAITELTRRQLKKLTNAITKFSTDSDKYSGKLIFLTWVLVIVGILTILVTGVSIWLGYITLQATTDPQVELYWQYHQPGVDMVDATTTVDLTLKNDFFGTIDDVNVFVDYFTLAQDKKDFSSIWTCDWQTNTLAVATTSSLKTQQIYNFSFPMVNFYTENSYTEQLKSLVNSESVVRVRVSFVKDAGHSPETKDFYYEAFDNRTLTEYSNFALPTQIRTQYGSMNRDQVVSLLQNAQISDFDERCSVSRYKRLKGL